MAITCIPMVLDCAKLQQSQIASSPSKWAVFLLDIIVDKCVPVANCTEVRPSYQPLHHRGVLLIRVRNRVSVCMCVCVCDCVCECIPVASFTEVCPGYQPLYDRGVLAVLLVVFLHTRGLQTLRIAQRFVFLRHKFNISPSKEFKTCSFSIVSLYEVMK